MADQPTSSLNPRRILLVDDNQAIHNDYRKVLHANGKSNPGFTANDEFLFGKHSRKNNDSVVFQTESAFQGLDAVKLVEQSVVEGKPFSVALVDIRMPPGLNGVETAKKIWEADPRVLIIFCTAYSDFSWTEMIATLDRSDQFVILKKPFDNLELLQLVVALSKKWELERSNQVGIDSLNETIRQQAENVHAARESLHLYVERLKLACIDIVYRQCHPELHHSSLDQSASKTFGSKFLEKVNTKIQDAADSAYQLLSTTGWTSLS